MKGQYRVLVTPEMAAQWLEYRRPHQRPLRPFQVRKLVRIMRSGGWRSDYPGGVIFSATNDGPPSLDDGQHTMHAIISHGMPVWCNVTTGASPDLYRYLGQDAPRSVADNNFIMSNPSKNKQFCSALNAARFVRTGRNHVMSPEVFDVWCDAYREHLVYVIGMDNRNRGISNAAVFVGLAEYHAIAPERSEKFCQSVFFADGTSQPGRMLRDHLLSMTKKSGCWQHVDRIYRSVLSCAVADYENRTASCIRPRPGWPDHMAARMPREMQDCAACE